MLRQEDRKKTVAELEKESELTASSALATATQTRAMHAETMQELEKQGKQIEKMQDNLDEINYDLKVADATTSRMASWFGWMFKKQAPSPQQPNTNKELKKEFAREDRADAKAAAKTSLRTSTTAAQQPAQIKIPVADSYRRTDETLDQLSDVLGDLHAMALDTNKELVRQNRRLDALNDTTEQANDKLRVVNRNVRGLIK